MAALRLGSTVLRSHFAHRSQAFHPLPATDGAVTVARPRVVALKHTLKPDAKAEYFGPATSMEERNRKW